MIVIDGCRDASNSSMFAELLGVMSDCNIDGLEYSGVRLTWSNYSTGHWRIESKMNRVLVNEKVRYEMPIPKAYFDTPHTCHCDHLRGRFKNY